MQPLTLLDTMNRLYRTSALLGLLLVASGSAIGQDRLNRGTSKSKFLSVIHVPVGKVAFTTTQIEENARAVIDAVAKARPHSVKGAFSSRRSPPTLRWHSEFVGLSHLRALLPVEGGHDQP